MDARERLEAGLQYERGGALERALREYETVREQTREPALRAAALIRIAHTLRVRCDWDGALSAARSAFETAASAGLDREQGEALNAEASVHHSRGAFDEAAAAYDRILSVTDDHRVRGMALQNSGALAAMLGDLETAEQRFGAAHAAFCNAGDVSGQAHVMNSYTAIALDRRDFELAERRARSAVESARAVGDLDLLGLARSNEAEALGGIGHFVEAEVAATEALGHFESSGNMLRRGHCLRILGDLTEKQGERATARRFYLRALSVFEAVGAEHEVRSVRTRLAELQGE